MFNNIPYIDCHRCDFRPGDLINEYTIDKSLGEGTFGHVYKVHNNHGDLFALKLLKLWDVSNEERQQLISRFDMEYDTGRIDSNYIVHSVDKGVVCGNPYIVMEFCPGGDLSSEAVWTKTSLSKVAAEVLQGLRDLHNCGKVHRDLKPANVLLRSDNTAVLTDFGIAGDRNHRLTKRGVFGIPKQQFGTYAYMPPEQVRPPHGNATVLPTTDIFSFGVMMYELCVHQLPFGELEKIEDLASYVVRGRQGAWNRDLLRQVPNGDAWVKLIDRCLMPNILERFQSAEEALQYVPEYSYQPSAMKSSPSVAHNKTLLRIMQGEGYGTTYDLASLMNMKQGCKILTMGRASNTMHNDIALVEEQSCYISRAHCTLEYDDRRDCWIIRDGQWRPTEGGQYQWLLSTNGTYVQSTEINQKGCLLKNNDIITIGDAKLRVECY